MSIKKDDMLLFNGDFYVVYCNKNKNKFYIYSTTDLSKELITVNKSKDGYKSSFDIDIMMKDLDDESNFQKTTELYSSLEFIKVAVSNNLENKEAPKKIEKYNEWGDITLEWIESNEGIDSKKKVGDFLVVTTKNNKRYIFLNRLSTEVKRDDKYHYYFEYHDTKASSMKSIKEVVDAFSTILQDMCYDVIKEELAAKDLVGDWLFPDKKVS